MNRLFSPNLILSFLSFLISGSTFLTYVFVTGFWSCAYGEDIRVFSLGTAFGFLSLGAGWVLGLEKMKPGVATLIALVGTSCFLTGSSIALVKVLIQLFNNQAAIPILIVSLSSFLAGLGIRSALSHLAEDAFPNRVQLACLSTLAPALLIQVAITLPSTFGYGKSSLLVGYVTLLVAALISVGNSILRKKSVVILATAAAALYLASPTSISTREAPKLRTGAEDTAQIVAQFQSPFQKLILTEERGESSLFPGIPQHVLYANGQVRFSSAAEGELLGCFTHIPIAIAEARGNRLRTALVLGGGEGLIARNLLASPKIEKITVVERDPDILALGRNEVKLRMYNLDSLRNKKVITVVADPFDWIRTHRDTFDLILVDLISSRNLQSARWFSSEFYSGVLKRLNANGLVGIRAGTLTESEKAATTPGVFQAGLAKNLSAVGAQSYGFFSPKDSQAFLVAAKRENANAAISFNRRELSDRKKSEPCRSLSEPRLASLAVTSLTSPKLLEFVEPSASLIAPSIQYSGKHSVFLPD